MNRYDVYEDGRLIATNFYHWMVLGLIGTGGKLTVVPSAHDARRERGPAA